jgi:uncharacterized protein YkwD
MGMSGTLAATCDRRSRRHGVVVAAVAAIVVLLLSACTPESRAALNMINDSRTMNGRALLQFHVDLWYKGQGWSDRLMSDQYLHHSNLADGLGHLPWRKLGENIAVAGSIGGAHAAFMGSTGHRNNILDSAFTHAAVGVSRDGSGRYWVVQEFMRL